MLYKKHESKSPLIGWRHRLLQHCSRYKITVSSCQRKEAENTPQKQLRMWITPMT